MKIIIFKNSRESSLLLKHSRIYSGTIDVALFPKITAHGFPEAAPQGLVVRYLFQAEEHPRVWLCLKAFTSKYFCVWWNNACYRLLSAITAPKAGRASSRWYQC